MLFHCEIYGALITWLIFCSLSSSQGESVKYFLDNVDRLGTPVSMLHDLCVCVCAGFRTPHVLHKGYSLFLQYLFKF